MRYSTVISLVGHLTSKHVLMEAPVLLALRLDHASQHLDAAVNFGDAGTVKTS